MLANGFPLKDRPTPSPRRTPGPGACGAAEASRWAPAWTGATNIPITRSTVAEVDALRSTWRIPPAPDTLPLLPHADRRHARRPPLVRPALAVPDEARRRARRCAPRLRDLGHAFRRARQCDPRAHRPLAERTRGVERGRSLTGLV